MMSKSVRFSDVIIFHKVGSTADDKNARNGLEWIQRACDRARLQRKLENMLKTKLNIHCIEKNELNFEIKKTL